jgi:ubiquinone/menaquinone biosynthesis C-methylase UbiE
MRSRNSVLWSIIAALLLCVSTHAPAQDKPAAHDKPADPPPPVEQYKGRHVAQTMHWLGAEWLIRQTREREERASVMLRQLGVKPGMTVCDMGCGNGFHALKLARMVGPEGKVIGVDIQQEMLDMLHRRAEHAEIKNIQTIRGELHDPRLAPASCDLILMVDVYHEFSHPEHMLKAMREALKPTGRIALVEFRLEDPDVPIKLLHKMSKAQIMKEYEPNGLKLVAQYDALPWQHLMFFERDDSPTEAVQMKAWEKAGESSKSEDASK